MENTLRCNWSGTLTLWTKGCNLIGDSVHGMTTHKHLCATAHNLLCKGETNRLSWGIPDLLTKWWPADLSAQTWPEFWAIFIVKIVFTRKMCHMIIYWQGWFLQTMVVSAAGTFIGHSLNLVPSFATKVQCCWSWPRITGTCEFDCDPLSHCQLLCLYRESSSQQIRNDTKRQAALWKSHGFKGNLCLGHSLPVGACRYNAHASSQLLPDCTSTWTACLEN